MKFNEKVLASIVKNMEKKLNKAIADWEVKEANGTITDDELDRLQKARAFQSSEIAQQGRAAFDRLLGDNG